MQPVLKLPSESSKHYYHVDHEILEAKETLRVPPSMEGGGCSTCPYMPERGSGRVKRNEEHWVVSSEGH